MSDPTTHITLDVLADYFAELLDDAREEAVELHIADCDRCAANARWVRSLPRPNLEGWTARAHGQAALTPTLAAALAEAEEANAEPGLKERLRHWRERLASESLHLIKEASGVLSRGLDVLMPPPGWEFAPRLIPVDERVPVSFKGSGPLTPPETTPMDVPTIRVIQKGIGIEVCVENLDVKRQPPLIVLIPIHQGGKIKVGALEPVRDDPQTLTARFMSEGVGFLIALEPA
jgi:hypothetical protein